MGTGTIFNSPEIPVVYVAGERTLSFAEQAPQAFEQLEGGIANFRGRKFCGVVVNGEYRACMAVRDSDSTKSPRFREYVIPGGRYFSRRLENYLSDPRKIGRLVDELIARTDFDPSRPVLEFHRGRGPLSLRVPVR